MTVIDFSVHSAAEKAVREVAEGVQSPRELEECFRKCTILPEPGRLYHVGINSDGYTLLFVIGKGQCPRSFDFVNRDFKWWEL